MHAKDIELLITDKVVKNLPKKYRKLPWAQIGPLLAAVISMVMQLFSSLSKNGPQPESRPAPTPARSQPEASHNRGKQTMAASGVKNGTLRAHLERAEAYQVEIRQLTQQSPDTAQADRLRDLGTHIEDWVAAIRSLVRRVDEFQQNRLIQQDVKAVPQAIASLEAQLAKENDPLLRTELERTLSSRRQQQQSLEQVQRTMQWTELKIESTLSKLGTIYSQALTGQSQDQVTNYRRLLEQVDEEVYSLQDYLAALEEVKLGSF